MSNEHITRKGDYDQIDWDKVDDNFSYQINNKPLLAVRVEKRKVKNFYSLNDASKILGYKRGECISHYTNSIKRRKEWTVDLNGRERFVVHTIVVKEFNGKKNWYVSKELLEFLISIRKKRRVEQSLKNKFFETFRRAERDFATSNGDNATACQGHSGSIFDLANEDLTNEDKPNTKDDSKVVLPESDPVVGKKEDSKYSISLTKENHGMLLLMSTFSKGSVEDTANIVLSNELERIKNEFVSGIISGK